jgi:FkbM family methyltransferase
MPTTASIDCEFALQGTRVRFHLPNPQDHIQRLIGQHRAFYEQDMLVDAATGVPDRALVVDVGANIGNHTVFFAAVLGAQVLAVEPNPAALSTLQANIALNRLEARVEVHAVALGASDSQGSMVDVDPLNLGRAQVRPGAGDVRIRRLDDLVGDRHVHLMKIDVEGMEAAVLQGAIATLSRCAPLLLVEAATVESLREVERVLRPIGYRKTRVYNATPTYLFRRIHERAATAPAGVPGTLDPAHLAALPRTTQVAAGMATVAGNEVALRATVMSLLPQVDRLYVYLNGFHAVPAFLRDHPKVRCQIDTDGRRYGDAGKFWGLEQVSDAVYLTCDDDIVYPEDFVARMVAELAQIGAQGAVGVHGSLIHQPTPGYYKDGSRAVFHFEHALLRRRRVHVVATNACAFHSSVVRMTLADFRHANMADIWLAQYLHRERLPSFVVPRPAGWLVSLEVERPTIYAQSRAATGSAYDSSRKQDEVLSTLYPVSLLQTRSPTTAHTVHVIHTDGADGVAAMIDAMIASEREPVVMVVADRSGDALRQAVLRAEARCEIHLLDRAAGIDAGYAALLGAPGATVQAWRLRNGVDLAPAPAGAWRSWLQAPPQGVLA